MKVEKYIPLIGSLLLLVYALFLFYMLPYYVLCTTDEVFYASIADSFVAKGLFIPTPFTVPSHPLENVKFYGFVYFYLVGNIVQLFGNDLIVYRSVSYFFMWACLGITYLFIHKEKVPQPLHYWFIALFVTDQIFTNSVMTGAGRMNSLALFLLLSAIFVLYYDVISYKRNLLNGIFGALLVIASLLTTPRILVLLPIFGVLFILKYYDVVNNEFDSKQRKHRVFLQFIFFALLSGSLYIIWALHTFDSLLGCYDYFFNQKLSMNGETQTMKEKYMIGNHNLTGYCLSAFLILGLSIFIFYKQYFQSLLSESYKLVIICVSLLILFLTLQNIYVINILPFLYILLFLFFKLAYTKYTKIINITFGVLFTINLSILGYRTVKNLLFVELKDEQKVTTIIKNAIPPHTNIIASDIYYYSALKSKLNYQIQYVDYYYSPDERLQFHLSTFNPKYLIISNKLNAEQQKNLELYKNYYVLTPHKKIVMTDSLSNLQQKAKKLFSLLKQQDAPSYDGMIYKMTKK